VTRPFLAIWPATGRWRVRQYRAPHGGPMGMPQLRYAVIDPAGQHIGSSAWWSVAQEAADRAARDALKEAMRS
jgi:hypothetical protein